MSKMQKIGLGLLGVIVVLAAIITTLGVLRKNSLQMMPVENDMMGAGSYPTSLSPSSRSVGDMQEKMSFQEEQPGNSSPMADGKRMIKTGNLNLKVDRLGEAQEKIGRVAKDNGGEIFSTNINRAKNNIRSGTVTVKVPVENFEKAFSGIKEVATIVVFESTNGQDATEEYRDLEVRLKNKQAEEQSYVRILEQAEKIDDILAVTRQLSMVRGEVESLEGQIRYMALQTDMSTIVINLSEDQDITVVDSWRPAQIVKEAVNALVKNMQGFVNFMIFFVIVFIPVLIPYLLVGLVMFFIIRGIYRKTKKGGTED